MKGYQIMMTKRASETPVLLKVKTGLKAGEHCKNAFKDYIENPNNSNANKFVSCCQGDNKCLQ